MAGLYQDPITVSGSLVTFNDPDGDGRITNLSAAISPIQDLNGYDHPWPGGGGKNLLPNLKYQNATNRVVIGQEVPYTDTTLTLESAEYTLTIKLANAISNPYVYLRHNEADTRLGYIASGLQKSFTFTAEAGTYSFSIYRAGVSVDDIEWFMLESGSTATAYEPYENICPITGHDTVKVYVSPTTDAEDATVYASQLGRTVYGGMIDLVTGVLTVTHGYIASYNGETLPSTWISDRDEYAAGATPTIGAEVVYALASPLTYQISAQTIQTLLGTNNIWADAGDVTVTYQLARHGFEGWLIKFGEGDGSEQLPWYLIEGKSLKVTPQQRMEWSAERDVNGNLHRETTDNMPTKIEFNIPPCTSNEMSDFTSMLRRHYTDAKQRKLHVQYYDPARDSFGEGSFYVPDIQFQVSMVDLEHNLITYDATRVAFIEY